MAKNYKEKTLMVLLSVALFLSGCASQQPAITKAVSAPEPPASGMNKPFPEFNLPMPQREAEKGYLGLSGTGSFTTGQIKAPVLIVEVFSFYCPYCQQAAPRVNELYQAIQGRPNVQDKIKIIGIGYSNSLYEVDSFKEKYNVLFPLFPDQNTEIFKLLGARGTPTFIGVKRNSQGLQEQFYWGEGAFRDVQQFLTEIIKLSGLEEEVKK